MALNLPNIEPANPWGDIVDVMNHLTEKALQQRINRAKADYAPYTEYANAASRIAYSNMLPYQIQATVLSNPLLMQAMKDHPEKLQSMLSEFQKSVPSGGNIFGGINLPPPGTGNSLNNSLLGLILNKFLGKGAAQSSAPPQVPQQNQSGGQYPEFGEVNRATPQEIDEVINKTRSPQREVSPTNSLNDIEYALAAPVGSAEQIIKKSTLPYEQLGYRPGRLLRTQEGGLTLTPTEGTMDKLQSQMLGIKNAQEAIEKVAKLGGEFLEPGAVRKLRKDQLIGLFQSHVAGLPDWILKKLNYDPERASRYASTLSEQSKSIENLMNAFNLPKDQEALHLVGKIVQPLAGESSKGYQNRMMAELTALKERYERNKGLAGQGFEIEKDIKVLPKFNNAEELRKWYAGLNKKQQAQARKLLGEK